MKRDRPSFLRSALNFLGLYTRSQIDVSRRNTGPLFAAAAINRLTNDWTTLTLSADAKTRQNLCTLRARSRVVADDDAYGKKFIRMLKTNVLGESGINLRVKAKDPDRVQGGKLVPGTLDLFANKQIENAWYEWGKKENCTVTKKMTWCDVQKLALSTTATDGECIIRKIVGFNNPFNFALQILESDYLDETRNEILPNGNEIRMGVELNVWKEPIAYHVLRKNPHDNVYGAFQVSERHYVIPASDIIHSFVQERPEQTRGWPWMTAGMKRLNMLDGYEEAVLVAKRVAASKMGFFEQAGEAEYKGDTDSLGNKYMDAEPGAFEVLPQGLKLSQWTPQDTDPNTAMFIKANLRGIAAAFGVSYNTLANDMESVNFASGQLGMDEERDVFKALQNWFIEHVCDDIFSDWLETQLASQKIPLPLGKFDKFNAPVWQGRRWRPVNIQQYVAAINEMLKLRVTSISRVLAEWGIDRDELFDEIEEDKQALEDRDIQSVEVFPEPEPDPTEMEPVTGNGRG